MDAERKSVAAELRSKGFSEGEKIRAEADRDEKSSSPKPTARRNGSKARRRQGRPHLSRAFSENPEFYSFYRSLDAYRASFKNKSDVLVLDSQFGVLQVFQETREGAAS